MVVGALAVIIALAIRSGTDASPPEEEPPPAGPRACAGVDAHRIELDTQTTDAPGRVCFEVEEPSLVTVGAAALDPDQDLLVTVTDAAGELLGEDAAREDWDPQVALVLEPGTYVVEITGADAEPPPFLIYTAVMPPPAQADDEPDVELPGADACGAEIPWLADGASVVISAEAPYVCIKTEVERFVGLGAQSSTADAEALVDLVLSVFTLTEGAEPALLMSGDDGFGTDPFLAVDLPEGIALVEVSAWFGQGFTDAVVTLDAAWEEPRTGAITATHASLTPEQCSGEADLTPGTAMTVEGERAYLCLEVDEQQRLTVEAATLTDQDLTLELIGFDREGVPFRLRWADDDPYVDALGATDPLIDTVVPAGTWVIAVTPYLEGEAADYDVRVAPAG